MRVPAAGPRACGPDVILVPSVTEALPGTAACESVRRRVRWRSQCVTVMASTVGEAAWSGHRHLHVGRGAVFGPPDTGFPATGVLAEAALNRVGWTYAEIDPAAIARVRRDGVVLNRAHWDDQHGRDAAPEVTPCADGA